MRHSYHQDKRTKVLGRGLDLAEAWQVFEGFYLTRADTKHSDVEERLITLGEVGEEIVLVIWTPRPGERRIITMWKANEKERQRYREQRDRSG